MSFIILKIPSLVKVFYEKFYKWKYIKFRKLYKYIKHVFKETFIIKKSI